jgi:hypothetical protein
MISLKVSSRSAYARDASADVARIRAHVAPGVGVDADVHVSLAPGAASRVLSLLLSELLGRVRTFGPIATSRTRVLSENQVRSSATG